jgi:protein-S-isoprenylcysteine O-methyltransferase Ste14
MLFIMNDQPKLTRSGYKRIIVIYLSMVFTAVLFFGSAGRIDLPRGWAYVIITALVQTNIFIVALVRFPEMAEVVNARGEMKMVKTWDKVFAFLYALTSMLLLPLIAGLDVGRYQWSELSLWWMVPGVIMLISAMLFSTWALLENKFFELAVRIQKERGQKVIMTGPYAIVRHPGYIAFILLYFSFPLIVGSFCALFVSLLIALLLVVRTALEDATLQKELEGYIDYTTKTRYRLIPFFW